LEEELRLLKSKLEQHSEEKIKLEMEVFCLKEITEELTKGKMTLLEEIARLSDQKKEGQELLNSEFSRLRISNNELQNNREKIEKENSELIVQISSLKVTLATVQSAYEQTQDEIKNHRMRLDEAGRREKQHNQEQEKLDEKSKKIEVEIKYLEERNRSVTVENKELSSSLNETRKRLESLEKELQTIKGENVLLLERLKQQESGDNAEGLDSGRSSTQASTLRKKLKEFRGKLSEEKKQRELHEFEIKNLKEKVERIVKKERENELQLESSRKKFLEVKTERDGLLMDLDSLNKRKKKDVEGYTSRIETLEDELR
jgi:chromosome segregation ATPase